MERRVFLNGLLATLLLPRWSRAAEPAIAVVCNADSGVTSLSRVELNAIFRAKVQRFPHGGRVTAVNLLRDNAARQSFDRVVLGLEPDEVERYWIDSKIRSGVGAPRGFPGGAAVARFVSGEPTAIGYVPVDGTPMAGLRVVAWVRDGRLVPS